MMIRSDFHVSQVHKVPNLSSRQKQKFLTKTVQPPQLESNYRSQSSQSQRLGSPVARKLQKLSFSKLYLTVRRDSVSSVASSPKRKTTANAQSRYLTIKKPDDSPTLLDRK